MKEDLMEMVIVGRRERNGGEGVYELARGQWRIERECVCVCVRMYVFIVGKTRCQCEGGN